MLCTAFLVYTDCPRLLGSPITLYLSELKLGQHGYEVLMKHVALFPMVLYLPCYHRCLVRAIDAFDIIGFAEHDYKVFIGCQ